MEKYLALDLGGSSLKAAILDEEANILENWKVSMANCKNEQEFLACFDKAVDNKLEDVKAICLSCPGRINTKEGIMETSGAYQRILNNYPLAQVLSKRYNLPVTIDNDARCACNGELYLGALKGVKNGFVYIIGTGIGGSLVVNGEVYTGSHHVAGEFSWIHDNLTDYDRFNNQSCRKLSVHLISKMYYEKTGASVDTEKVFEYAEAGNKIAQKVLKRYCRYHANCIYTIQTIFDCEKVAIGGAVSVQPLLIETIKKELQKLYVDGTPSIMPEIVRCKYGNDANLIGAFINYKQHNK